MIAAAAAGVTAIEIPLGHGIEQASSQVVRQQGRIAGCKQHIVGADPVRCRLQSGQGTLVIIAQVRECRIGVIGVKAGIAVTADKYGAHLRGQPVPNVGDQRPAAPQYSTLVAMARAGARAARENDRRYVVPGCRVFLRQWFLPLRRCGIIRFYHSTTCTGAMTGILAIDTATEACSVALWRDGNIEERHELADRRHSQRIFSMLRELFPDGRLRQHGVEAIAWGSGPGSFTGLRIAAAAVQGLAFSNDLPVVAVSTLACQAQTALREGHAAEGETLLSTLDARINEVYAARFRIDGGLPREQGDAVACPPGELALEQQSTPVVAIGSGCRFLEDFPAGVRDRITQSIPDLLPRARDLLPLALEKLARGETQSAGEVQPVYVRDEINWKKIPEQGKRK